MSIDLARKSSGKENLEEISRLASRISFSKDPSAPLLGCKTGRLCWRIRGDYWLAGAYEKKVFSSLFRRVFGVYFDARSRHIVFHRIPAPSGEYAVEVFGEASRLGALEYVVGKGWVYYPSGAAASLAASLGASRIEYNGGRRLKGKKIVVEGGCEGEWALVSQSGWIGAARVVESSRKRCVLKVRDMAPLGFKLLNQASIEELVELNKRSIGVLASEARRFIRRLYARYQASKGKLYVAFSGGADSTALLVLAAESVSPERVVAVYADTGIEFRETKRYVERIASMLGVDLEIVEPSRDPLSLIKARGLMTRSRRWCTRLLKLEPLRKYYERRGVRLVLDGARMRESDNRAKTPREGENPLVPGVARGLPLYYWPRMAVQLYLYEKGIPLNPLYDKGFTRIGCIICPAMHLYELHIAYSMYRSWYAMLAEALRESSGSSTSTGLESVLKGEWRRKES